MILEVLVSVALAGVEDNTVFNYNVRCLICIIRLDRTWFVYTKVLSHELHICIYSTHKQKATAGPTLLSIPNAVRMRHGSVVIK